MCLGIIYSEETQKQIIDNMKTDKNGYVTLFKTVNCKKYTISPIHFSIHQEEGYEEGENVAEIGYKIYTDKMILLSNGTLKHDTDFYYSGFHLYVNKIDAIEEVFYWGTKRTIHIPVKVKKEWITTIGRDQCNNGPLTAIVTKMIVPKINPIIKLKSRTMEILYSIKSLFKSKEKEKLWDYD